MFAPAPYYVINNYFWPRETVGGGGGEYSALNTAPPLLTQDHSTVTTTNSVVTSHSDVYQSRSRVEVTALGALLGKCSSCRVVNELTVNKRFDYLAYLALGSSLILFTQRPLGSVNRVLSHFHFAQHFYLHIIYREKFHESIRSRLEKQLFDPERKLNRGLPQTSFE